MADSYTFAKVYNEIESQAGRDPKYSDEELTKFKEGTEPGYQTTNWYDKMTKALTPQHQTNLSVAGGTKTLDYYMSIGEMAQDGHFSYGSTKVKRYNFRSNINVHVSDNLNIGLDVSGRYDKKHYPGNSDTRGIYSHMYLYLPMWELHWPGTNYLKPNRDSQSLVNWVSDNSGWTNDEYKAIESKLHFSFKVPWVKGLTIKGSANYDAGYNFVKSFSIPDYVHYYDETANTYTKGRSGDGNDLASLNEEFNQTSTLTLNTQLNYDRTFGKHSLGVLLGYEQMEYSYDYLYAARTDFPSSVLPELFAGSSDKNKQFETFIFNDTNIFIRQYQPGIARYYCRTLG